MTKILARWAAGVILLLAAVPAAGQLSTLGFRPSHIFYSPALDRLVMTGNGQLHLYDPGGKLDQTMPLPIGTNALSLSPDGKFLAAAHGMRVSYIDLATRSVTRVFDTFVTAREILLLPQYIVIVPTGTPGYQVGLRALSLASGGVVGPWPTQVYHSNQYFLAPIGDGSGFVVTDGTQAIRCRITNGVITQVGPRLDSCWAGFTIGGGRFVDKCGDAHREFPLSAQDYGYRGSLGYKVESGDYLALRNEVAIISGHVRRQSAKFGRGQRNPAV